MSTGVMRCPECSYAFGHAPGCSQSIAQGATDASALPSATTIAGQVLAGVPTPSPTDVLAATVEQARRVASSILRTADDTVSNQRQNQHGQAEDSFQMIADLWKVLMKHRGQDLGPTDVAFMMTMLKIARATYGNPSNPDHYVDGAGYMGLAAELAGAKV